MNVLLQVLLWAVIAIVAIIAGTFAVAIPALFMLPPGRRPGLAPMTLHEAADKLDSYGLKGWSLVSEARKLVALRMEYCRRNSFDSPLRAFDRGYGYCQQHAFALKKILEDLGFDAKVVQAVRNRFSNGRVGGHAWVRVWHDAEWRDFDSTDPNPDATELSFTVLSPVTGYSRFFYWFSWWGSAAVNAIRWYRTGRDK